MSSSVAWSTIKNCLAQWMIRGSGLAANRIRWNGQNAPMGNTSLPWITLRLQTINTVGTDFTQYVTRAITFADKPFTLDAAGDKLNITAHGLATRDGAVRLETTGSLSGTNLDIDTDYWCVKTDNDHLRLAASFLEADAGTYIDITGAGTGTHTLVSTADTVKAGEELTEYARGLRRMSVSIQCFPAQPQTPGEAGDSLEATAILSDIVSYGSLDSQFLAFSNANMGMVDLGSPSAQDGAVNNIYFEPRAIMTVVFYTTSEIAAAAQSMEYVEIEFEDIMSTTVFWRPLSTSGSAGDFAFVYTHSGGPASDITIPLPVTMANTDYLATSEVSGPGASALIDSMVVRADNTTVSVHVVTAAPISAGTEIVVTVWQRYTP